MIGDKMIDKCWELGGMGIDRQSEVLGEYLPQCHFVRRISHVTWHGV
jgi:hypothetical protein